MCGLRASELGDGSDNLPGHTHLDYYLDEFTFRFNRRNSRSRGKLFMRLAEQAVAVGPAPYKSMVKCFANADAADHNI